ncbi:peptidoglycan-binding domain-containing protein [Streptomyces sp. NPDC005648]|uniref:peptidoglycan-binding domain-containing protein n=1 Tax=Streptomyces sp. NPDC005648 TaxID=3157044 RepID=UPI0033B8E074
MSTTAQETTAQVRQEMVANSLWGVQHNADIHYSQTRPMPIGIPKDHLPFSTDCSGFATLMAKWSGAGDPNGSGFDGDGYTGTMLDHCEHISASETQPGDFVVFGAHPGTHVVVLVESAAGGLAAMCVSHGQEAGPLHVSLEDEAKSHAGEPLTYLRLPGAGGASPTPAPPSSHRNPFCPLAVDGQFGTASTKALQWVLGVPTDGSFGPVTKKALQSHLKVTADGDIGPATVRALQAHVGVTPDGKWGPLTTKGLQQALNAGRF